MASQSLLESIGRENLERVQRAMDEDGIDALALTDVWSFNPLVFVPIYDLEIPRIVLVPGRGEPIMLAPHWGYRSVVETTWVSADRIHEFAPFSQHSDRDVPDEKQFDAVLAGVLSELDVGETVGMDLPRTGHAEYRTVESAVDADVVDANPALNRALGPKTDDEIELIRESVEAAEAGVDAALSELEPGTAEFEIAAAAEGVMRPMGDRLFPFDYHYAAGPHSLQPARRVSDREVEAGETFNVDVLPLVNGYYADICRCTVVGDVEPTDEQRKLYETVLAAHDVIHDTAAAGVAASELDRAIRKFFEDEGYPGQFIHHTGHTVGTHFGPDILPSSDDVLRENHVVAIEPGLYAEGVGGVRIEDIFVVGKDGVDSMMDYPKDLL